VVLVSRPCIGERPDSFSLFLGSLDKTHGKHSGQGLASCRHEPWLMQSYMSEHRPLPHSACIGIEDHVKSFDLLQDGFAASRIKIVRGTGGIETSQCSGRCVC
jgi:hypothetical protein